MDKPQTLDQALEQITAQTARIQGLENTIAERDAALASVNSDMDSCMKQFGITKIAGNGATNWTSSEVTGLTESVAQLSTERDNLQTELTGAKKRITELEADQRTVSARAREFLAAQGGKPLAVSSSGAPKPTNKQQLIDAMDAAQHEGNKDEAARLYAEIKKLPK